MDTGKNQEVQGEVGTPPQGSGEPKTAREYVCQHYGCRLVSTGETRYPRKNEHFLEPDGRTGNKAAFDFEAGKYEILQHVGTPAKACIRGGLPGAVGVPEPQAKGEDSHDENCFLAMGGGGLCNCSQSKGPSPSEVTQPGEGVDLEDAEKWFVGLQPMAKTSRTGLALIAEVRRLRSSNEGLVKAPSLDLEAALDEMGATIEDIIVSDCRSTRSRAQDAAGAIMELVRSLIARAALGKAGA